MPVRRPAYVTSLKLLWLAAPRQTRVSRVAGLSRPLLPAPASVLKLAARPLQLLPRPPLTPDAVDFVNQPATVDNGPLLARLPRRLTPLEEGLRTYLGSVAGDSTIVFDQLPHTAGRRSVEASSPR